MIFIYSQLSSLALGPTQSLVQWILGFFPGSKEVRRDFDHSSPLSTEIKVSGTITLLPLYTFTSWTGTTQSYYFTLQKYMQHIVTTISHVFSRGRICRKWKVVETI